VAAAAVLVALAGAAPAGAVQDTFLQVADQPAATLLLPYFEVDLDDPAGVTTTFSVNNASASAAVAHVTVWSDLSVPVLAFDVYLTGYDVQVIDLRDVLEGRLPVTADAGADPGDNISNQGPLSQDINFPGSTGPCGFGGTTYPPELPPETVAHVQAALTGQFSALAGGCCGRALGDRVARGYVTVDTVTQCSLEVPGSPGYFFGIADYRNIFWGEYFLFRGGRSPQASGDTLVPVLADSTPHPETVPGEYTFYARYVASAGTDRRQPLATTFAARYRAAAGGRTRDTTDLLVWRDAKVVQEPFECGTLPPWYPLGQEKLIAFDEEERATVLSGVRPFPAATQRVRVGGPALPVPYEAGWLYLNLNTGVAEAPGIPTEDPGRAQAWVVELHEAGGGRVAIGHRAIPLDHASGPHAPDPDL
jgi:hypothetical protein